MFGRSVKIFSQFFLLFSLTRSVKQFLCLSYNTASYRLINNNEYWIRKRKRKKSRLKGVQKDFRVSIPAHTEQYFACILRFINASRQAVLINKLRAKFINDKERKKKKSWKKRKNGKKFFWLKDKKGKTTVYIY